MWMLPPSLQSWHTAIATLHSTLLPGAAAAATTATAAACVLRLQ